MKQFFKYFAVVLVIIVACDSNESKPSDIGLNYFPLRTGFFQIYSVESIQYSEVSDPVTLNYELKTEVVDSFPSGDQITYVIHRSKRQNPSSDWEALDTWSARMNDREVVVNEGNTAYAKLLFPVHNGLLWNGNQYNSLGTDEFELLDVNESFSLAGGTTFDNTLTVQQEDNEDFIVALDQRKEVYAKDAGLIYKEITQLEYCTADNCRGQQIVENGIVYKQSLKEYGIQ